MAALKLPNGLKIGWLIFQAAQESNSLQKVYLQIVTYLEKLLKTLEEQPGLF